MNLLPHSIRWRLQLWLGFLLVAVLSGFGIAVYQLHRVNQFQQLDEELERRVSVLSAAVRGGPPPEPPGKRSDAEKSSKRPPPPPESGPGRSRPGPKEFRLPASGEELFETNRPDAFYYVAWYRDGSLLRQSANAPEGQERPLRDAQDTRRHFQMRDGFRELYHFTELGDCVLAGRSIAPQLAELATFRWWLIAAGGGVLAFGLGVGWWLTNRAIRPVEEISAAASRISAGNLAERIHTTDPQNELGRLAGVLNSTFARLEAAFAQQKQFTADAAHELRTPLAIMISEAQTTLARERSAAEYRETVEGCLETAQQMRRLAESLLELSRFDAGQETIARQPLDLAKVTADSLERLHPLLAQRNLRLRTALGPAPTLGDSERLGQVLNNLLTNAIYYNMDGGEITVGTSTEKGIAILRVTNTGPGIAPEELPHLFKRFYRADKSRGDGRSGLGLSICKAIVEAHGGKIEAASKAGQRVTFTVELPAANVTESGR
jgi:heavy metal sensor kinase